MQVQMQLYKEQKNWEENKKDKVKEIKGSEFRSFEMIPFTFCGFDIKKCLILTN